MALDALNKAFSAADSMVALARIATKSAGPSPLPGVMASAIGDGDADRQTISNASDQYAANRGWVFSCVRLISSRIAGQQIHVARERTTPQPGGGLSTKGGGCPLWLKSKADRLEPLASHPLLDLLADPNELGTAWTLLATSVMSLELTGRCLWYVAPSDGRLQILPIPTSWIRETDRRRSVWKIRLPFNGQEIDLPGDQVAYFYYPNPADPWGALSPLSAIAQAVVADDKIGECHWRTFSQGPFPGLIVKAGTLDPMPGQSGKGPQIELTPEQRQQIVASILKVFHGVHKLGHPLILDRMIEDVSKLSLTPSELDFLNSAKLTKSKILQGYGVSPILLGEVEGANRASATVADEIFVANKVNPLIELLSQCLTEWLAPMFARAGEKLTVWIEPAIAHDPEMAFRRWSFAASGGIVTKNEYRRNVLNLPDMAGGDVPAEVTRPAAAKSFSGDLKAAVTELWSEYP